MSIKLKATLVGGLIFIGGMALYVLLASFVGLIPGISLALIAVGFFGIYQKLNPTDKSWDPVVISGLLTAFGAAIGILLSALIGSAMSGFRLDEYFADPDCMKIFITTLIITLSFAVLSVVLVIFMKIKAKKDSKKGDIKTEKDSLDDSVSEHKDHES